VLFRAGQSIGQSGLLVSAGRYYEKLLAAATVALGPDHPDTLMIRANRARWRGQLDPLGSSKEAADTARAYERVLGPEDRQTLNAHFWQAYWAGEAGNLTGAGQVLQHLLALQVRILGPDDPDTLRTRHNLIYFYYRHVEWEDDSRLRIDPWTEMHQLLEDETRVLGADHLDTLTTRYTIATMAGGQLSPLQTIYRIEEVLKDQTRVLGPDHPDTLASRYSLTFYRNLMNAFTRDGRLEGEAEMRSLLEDLLRVLGPDHPMVFNARGQLAYYRLYLLGDPVAAELAFQELLNDQLRVFGADHPTIRDAQQFLEFASGPANKRREAIKFLDAVRRDELMPDNGGFSHLVGADSDLEAAISNCTPIAAICGWTWVPKRSSKIGDDIGDLPACPGCASIRDSQ
jgi:hypothetical protein